MPAMRAKPLVALLSAVALVAGCGDDNDDENKPETQTATEQAAPQPSGKTATKPKVAKGEGPAPKRLEKKDLVVGKGRAVKDGDAISVQYVGVLYKNGKQFDASWNRGQPFDFTLGAGEVIPGWDQGVGGMREGGRRRLEIPPKLAYGEQGAPPDIGPNEPLVFVIDLVRVR
jgi:peptidylprolyl isomerase